jgi:hypothetical protein
MLKRRVGPQPPKSADFVRLLRHGGKRRGEEARSDTEERPSVQERLRDRQAEGFGGFEVDDELERIRLFYR